MPHYKAFRKWETFEGKNIFHFNGLCIAGPKRATFRSAGCLMIGTLVVFWASICPWWVEEYSDQGIIITCFSVYLGLGSLITFFVTAFSDPGIIPRAPPCPEDDNPWSTQKPPPFKKVDFGSQRMKIKYCATCRIYRPPRAIHCSICDNCIDRFDHYCPWLGTCIGRRNYKYYLFFVYSVLANAVYMGTFSVLQFAILVMDSEEKTTQEAVLEAWRTSPLALPLALFCAIGGANVGVLAAFHFYLIFTGQTTNEKLKGAYKKEKNPFNRGPLRNFLFLCFQPSSPPHINFKEQILELDVRPGKDLVGQSTSSLSKASNNPIQISATH